MDQQSTGWRITRREDEALLDAMAERVRNHPEIMKQRKQMVEHPCGTMKRALNHGYFLLRGLPNVRADMSLTVLTYNLKRVLNILGVERLLAVRRARRTHGFTHTIRRWMDGTNQCHSFPSRVVVDFSHSLAPCWATICYYFRSWLARFVGVSKCLL